MLLKKIHCPPFEFFIKKFLPRVTDFILIMKTHAMSKYFNMEIFSKNINI